MIMAHLDLRWLVEISPDCIASGWLVVGWDWDSGVPSREAAVNYFHRMEIEINFIDLIPNPLHDYQPAITCIDFIK